MTEFFPTRSGVAVDIGGMPILLCTGDHTFRTMLQQRYTGFLTDTVNPRFAFDIDLEEPPPEMQTDDDVRVRFDGGRWILRRGDFFAEWNPSLSRGRIRQTANPYAIDSVLRIVHTLILAREGGFLMHSASAIRNGRAFLFAGVSGAGKTTISRLAPPEATLLSDEISYVRRDNSGYFACGTPFSGELAQSGENTSAPVSTVFLLAKGPENRIEEIDTQTAVHSLLRHILFFADDAELVRLVFQSACEFVDRVPVRRLTFTPDQRVWEMIS
jgi:hypothetical protein